MAASDRQHPLDSAVPEGGEAGEPRADALWNPATGRLTLLAHAALVAAAAGAWAYYANAERIPWGYGLGWDGGRYGGWVWTLADDLANGNIDDYYVRRIFPSALIWLAARASGTVVTLPFVIGAFVLANACCVWVAGLFWLRCCAALRLGRDRTLAGALLVLVGYATLKFPAYYPVLTDLFAFALGMATLDCWVRGNLAGLVAATAASMFTWPTAAIVGVPLLLFPRGSRASLGGLSRLVPWLAAAAALAAGGVAFHGIVVQGAEVMPVPTRRGLLALSLPIMMGYVFACARGVLGALAGPGRARLPLPGPWRVLVTAVAVGGVAVAQRLLANGHFPDALKAIQVLAGSVNLPALFLVADFTYFGALAALAALFLPGALRAAADLGLGALIVIAFGLALNLYPEPRFVLNVVPFVALAVVLAAPLGRISTSRWVFLAACQLSVSKVWLEIGARRQDFEAPLYQGFPAQWLFMSQGPWMADLTWAVQGGIAAVAVAVAAVLFRGPIPRPSSPAP